MQIVITLPDAYAEIIQKVQNGSVASKIILEAVKGGIVLPKNHGRLIDAKEAEDTDQKEYRYKFDSSHYLAVCDYINGGCGASTGGMYTTPEAAAEAWNRRADNAPT